MSVQPGASGLTSAVRAALREAAVPANAEPMRAYMKSAMPYLGVKTPERRRLSLQIFAAMPLADLAAWRDAVLDLWRNAEYREERYAALELCSFRRNKVHQTTAALPLYKELIVTGAWWDFVDWAAARVGDVLRAEPEKTAAILRGWATGDDIWLRRTSIICQLRAKAATDRELLFDCIEPSIENSEFFLRKGIGWALREYAKTEPEAVVRYVRRHADRLSPLSKREALRRLINAGTFDSIP